jgi:hypothetical protein
MMAGTTKAPAAGESGPFLLPSVSLSLRPGSSGCGGPSETWAGGLGQPLTLFFVSVLFVACRWMNAGDSFGPNLGFGC